MKFFICLLIAIAISVILACDNTTKENMCYYSKKKFLLKTSF